MICLQLLFSFKGRINRARLWLAGFVLAGSLFAIAIVLMLGILLLDSETPGSLRSDASDVFRLVDPAFYRLAIDTIGSINSLSLPAIIQIGFRVFGSAVAAWCLTALAVRRLHDRGKTAWWIAPYFVLPGLVFQFEDRLGGSCFAIAVEFGAAAIYIWAIIEIVVLKGDRGPNRFGPDPVTSD